MAASAKRGMLGRSTAEYRANFASDEVADVRVGAQTNGYAATVAFRGRDGSLLVTLIEYGCYIGWTQR